MAVVSPKEQYYLWLAITTADEIELFTTITFNIVSTIYGESAMVTVRIRTQTYADKIRDIITYREQDNQTDTGRWLDGLME